MIRISHSTQRLIRNSVLRTLFWLIPLLFVRCEKSYGIEVSLGPETTISISSGIEECTYREQDILLREMQARNQVADFKEYKGTYTVSFHNGKDARFSDKVFPLILPDENTGKWKLSGRKTDISIQRNADKSVRLPALDGGEDGFWTLDGTHTDLPTDEYLKFCLEEGNDTLNVKGFLSVDDILYIYLSDDSIRKYSVLREGFYRVPDYWMEHLVEKEKKIEATIAETGGDYASFVFFTDAHWGFNFKHSSALVRHITEFTPVSDVFFGGDVITDRFGDKSKALALGKDFQASFAYLGPRFFCVYGNHDDNSDGQPKLTANHLSEELVISYLQSQMTELDRKDGYNFYFDDPVSKTRFIGLDTGRYYYNGDFRIKTPDTAQFLVDALQDVPEGWHIVSVSHIWAVYKLVDGKPSSIFNAYFNTFLKIIDDYNGRKKGTFKYDNTAVDYDFTDAQAEALLCIGGHTHNDKLLHTEGKEPVMIIGADSLKRGDYSGIQGTIGEQHLVVFVLDYAHRNIHMIFLGDTEDRILEMPTFQNPAM